MLPYSGSIEKRNKLRAVALLKVHTPDAQTAVTTQPAGSAMSDPDPSRDLI
jgi:hypothetical protein